MHEANTGNMSWLGLALSVALTALALGACAMEAAPGDEPGSIDTIGTVAGALGELCKSNDACGDGAYCRRKTGQCSSRGHCAATPTVCPAIDNPVCGCDGQTWASACEASAHGVSVASMGACVPKTCRSDSHCAGELYCNKDSCDPDAVGLCSVKPDGCFLLYDPVCGCDGSTWSNACMADAAGVNVASEGACAELCDGLAGLPCPSGQFCEHEPGTCDVLDGAGDCELLPEVCPAIYAPVCGCDGVTYGNECERQGAGVSKDFNGTCEPKDCEHDAQCDEGQLCKKAGCSGVGVCSDVPEGCDDVYEPVCGCDGETHSNACYAWAAGTNIDYDGACDAGCESNPDCAAGDYCQKKSGCDGVGECTWKPEGCGGVYDPVCGCDGSVHSNACMAAAAGVNVAADSLCGLAGGCQHNSQCSADEYCQTLVAQCGAEGTCAWKPEACTLQYDPVCGCDGESYGNACTAMSAGMNISSTGACGALE